MGKKATVITAILSVLFIAFCIYNVFFAGKIKPNDPSTIGNSAGNLHNNGYFCEDDGVVYFSNPYDNGCLYSMNPDGTQMKKLIDASVKYINAAGEHLYFCQENASSNNMLSFLSQNVAGVYRTTKEGRNAYCFSKDLTQIISLSGNYLLYQRFKGGEGMSLFKSDLEGKANEMAVDYEINPACIQNGIVYFNNTPDSQGLYAFHVDNNTVSSVAEGNIWFPIIQGGYIYYMNADDNYRLYRMELSGHSTEKLTDDRVDNFNVGQNYIYYQKNDPSQPAMKRMGLEGLNPEIVMNGNFSNINLTSTFAYFHAFQSRTELYRTPVNGAINVTPFTAAMEAARQEQTK